MVSGPIKRYPEFEKELIQAKATPALLSQGITRILVGLAKKHVLADTLSLWSSQLNTDLISTAPRLSVLMWVLAYGLKIYFDFSGYSDIAIGSGYCFGIKLPENFNWPYLSSNISEFWRRWHISLGRWLFDYIYAPLGGSKKGSLSASRNLLITFGVSGLWHGASYHFVVWGLWHGFLVVMHRAWKAWAHPRSIYIHRIFSIILTYLLVNLGWVFFCVEFSQGLKIFSRLFKFWGIS
jgi:alginate O-acetyltransferase complex protein AlgI